MIIIVQERLLLLVEHLQVEDVLVTSLNVVVHVGGVHIFNFKIGLLYML